MKNKIKMEPKIIAVDFDGTIVEHKYPKIGKEILFAFSTLKELKKLNYKLILWTVRSGKTVKKMELSFML